MTILLDAFNRKEQIFSPGMELSEIDSLETKNDLYINNDVYSVSAQAELNKYTQSKRVKNSVIPTNLLTPDEEAVQVAGPKLFLARLTAALDIPEGGGDYRWAYNFEECTVNWTTNSRLSPLDGGRTGIAINLAENNNSSDFGGGVHLRTLLYPPQLEPQGIGKTVMGEYYMVGVLMYEIEDIILRYCFNLMNAHDGACNYEPLVEP